MQDKQTEAQPLSDREHDALLRFLQRIIATTTNETVRRVANSLFTVLTKDRYS